VCGLTGKRCYPASAYLCGLHRQPKRLLSVPDKPFFMSDTILRGTVSFVQYEKHFATIEYKQGSKTKSVNCKTAAAAGVQQKHYFRTGDEVTFKLKLSDRGDKMTAYDVQFLYNPGLDKLVQKARHENRFTGYLKKVDEDLYIKEVETYLFFPLRLSPWENHPGEQSFNAPVTFRLINLDKPKKIAAALYFQVFRPEYRQAQQAFESKTPLQAIVNRVTPHAVYIHLYEGKIGAKVNMPTPGFEGVQPGDEITVTISYLSEEKVAVQKA
jgi:hypothetical protein